MNSQHPLTLITPVKKDGFNDLSVLLEKIKADLIAKKQAQFENIGTIHYLRLVLINPEGGKPARFVFATDYDGDEEEHLAALSTTSADFIDQLYAYCDGYPCDNRTPLTRKEYLKKWRVKSSAFFAGAQGRDLQQINKENELRNFIRNFLNTKTWKGTSAKQLHAILQQQAYQRPEFAWAKEPIQLPKKNWFGLALLVLILIILLPVILIWVLILHFVFEKHDKPLGLTPSQVNEDHLQSLEDYEDLENQNQFTQMLIMKPGKMRLITLQALMIFAKALIKFLFVDGKLMGIPTIHFARWLMMDDNKQMLFFSNFDGSWQQYLGDFIDKSGWGLTGIWSNTINFPTTRFLFWGGAYDEEHFLAWSRYYEIPTQVWYCAYPHLSIKNIVNNSLIRYELSKNLSEDEAEQFLKRL